MLCIPLSVCTMRSAALPCVWSSHINHTKIQLQATYIADGIKKKSLLLASGWWGISRHFHYIPEIAASVLWTVPTACEGHLIPFFYAVYLTILLTDRAFRDDVRWELTFWRWWWWSWWWSYLNFFFGATRYLAWSSFILPCRLVLAKHVLSSCDACTRKDGVKIDTFQFDFDIAVTDAPPSTVIRGKNTATRSPTRSSLGWFKERSV